MNRILAALGLESTKCSGSACAYKPQQQILAVAHRRSRGALDVVQLPIGIFSSEAV
jgi:hypothetical protein